MVINPSAVSDTVKVALSFVILGWYATKYNPDHQLGHRIDRWYEMSDWRIVDMTGAKFYPLLILPRIKQPIWTLWKSAELTAHLMVRYQNPFSLIIIVVITVIIIVIIIIIIVIIIVIIVILIIIVIIVIIVILIIMAIVIIIFVVTCTSSSFGSTRRKAVMFVPPYLKSSNSTMCKS